MQKEQIQAQLDELEEKAALTIKDAQFKINQIQKQTGDILNPIFEQCMDLERKLYDGKTRVEVFEETGRDPKTGKTREELMAEMFTSMISGASGMQNPEEGGPFGG
jgi:hypothetical protein